MNEQVPELKEWFKVCVIDDDRTTEIVLMHKATNTVVLSDLLYRSSVDVVGPGSKGHPFTAPIWFRDGMDELFYERDDGMSHGLLPKYRTHPNVRNVKEQGLRASLKEILSWDIEHLVGCHVDPLGGCEARELLSNAWEWVLRGNITSKL